MEQLRGVFGERDLMSDVMSTSVVAIDELAAPKEAMEAHMLAYLSGGV